MLRLGGVTHGAKRELAIGSLAQADERLRSYAAAHGRPTSLKLTLGDGRFEQSFDDEGRTAREVSLGGGAARLLRYRSLARDASAGDVKIEYSPQGTTETFAIELGIAGGDSVWLLFAGLTGQLTQLEEERDVESILQAIRPDGLDAD